MDRMKKCQENSRDKVKWQFHGSAPFSSEIINLTEQGLLNRWPNKRFKGGRSYSKYMPFFLYDNRSWVACGHERSAICVKNKKEEPPKKYSRLNWRNEICHWAASESRPVHLDISLVPILSRETLVTILSSSFIFSLEMHLKIFLLLLDFYNTFLKMYRSFFSFWKTTSL